MSDPISKAPCRQRGSTILSIAMVPESDDLRVPLPPSVAHVQTKREIEELLVQRGLRPNKRFGQCFLVDGNLMRRLVSAAEIGAGDVILEVGAGTGGLTQLLAAQARRVVCVEIDRELFPILEDSFRDQQNVQLIHGDVLSGKHHLSAEVAEAMGTDAVKLVSNLPYQIATPLLFNLLVDYPQVRRMVFTVQAEVGERITASAGGKEYGALSVVTRLFSRVEIVARLPAHVFWPRPKVESVMLRIDRNPEAFLPQRELPSFLSLLRGTFDHRRKTLRAAMGYAVDAEAVGRVCRALDGTRRPESFAPEEWVRIYELAMGRDPEAIPNVSL